MQPPDRTTPRTQPPAFSPSVTSSLEKEPDVDPAAPPGPNATAPRTIGSAARTLMRRARRVGKMLLAALGCTLLVTYAMALWGIVHTPVTHPAARPLINDVTQINPIQAIAETDSRLCKMT